MCHEIYKKIIFIFLAILIHIYPRLATLQVTTHCHLFNNLINNYILIHSNPRLQHSVSKCNQVGHYDRLDYTYFHIMTA